MMTKLISLLAGAALLAGVTSAGASTLVPSKFTAVTPMLLDDATGNLDYEGDQFVGPIGFLDAAAGGYELSAFIDAGDFSDASLSFPLSSPVGIIDNFDWTITTSIMSEAAEFFFELGSTGYLFEIAIPTGIGSFTDGSDQFGTNAATISLTEYTVAPVPLPAGLPLVLAGVGAFAWVKRQRKATV